MFWWILFMLRHHIMDKTQIFICNVQIWWCPTSGSGDDISSKNLKWVIFCKKCNIQWFNVIYKVIYTRTLSNKCHKFYLGVMQYNQCAVIWCSGDDTVWTDIFRHNLRFFSISHHILYCHYFFKNTYGMSHRRYY